MKPDKCRGRKQGGQCGESPEEEGRLPGAERFDERHRRNTAETARNADHRAKKTRHELRFVGEGGFDDDGENDV